MLVGPDGALWAIEWGPMGPDGPIGPAGRGRGWPADRQTGRPPFFFVVRRQWT